MAYILSGSEFDIDFVKIYNMLSFAEKKSYDASGFRKRLAKSKKNDITKSVKYIIGPPYSEDMEDNSALSYIMFFGMERDKSRDKIQICNFAFRANLVLDQLSKEKQEEFLSLLPTASYSYALKHIFEDKAMENIIPDKCVNFYFDESQYENVYKLALYKSAYGKYKAQQWTEDKTGITKGPKETVSEDIFFAIMGKAIDLMLKSDNSSYKDISSKCMTEIREYFDSSTEETVSSYELKDEVYRVAIEKGYIPKPMYDYDHGEFILVKRFESRNYNQEYLMSRSRDKFIIGNQINPNIELDTEKDMVYSFVDNDKFKESLFEAIVNLAHREHLLTAVNGKKLKLTSQFDNLSLFENGGIFDFDEFYREILLEACEKDMVALNPYSFYEGSTVIPNLENMIFSANKFKNFYMVSYRDSIGVVCRNKTMDQNTFLESLYKAIVSGPHASIDKNKICIDVIDRFRMPNSGFDSKGFFSYITNGTSVN